MTAKPFGWRLGLSLLAAAGCAVVLGLAAAIVSRRLGGAMMSDVDNQAMLIVAVLVLVSLTVTGWDTPARLANVVPDLLVGVAGRRQPGNVAPWRI